MKGSTNGMNVGKGVMEYTELEPTLANLQAIGMNQQVMLVLDNVVIGSRTLSGVVYFVGPLLNGQSNSTMAWGSIGYNDRSLWGLIYLTYIKDNELLITITKINSNTNISITPTELLAHTRLYVADLPGGGTN